MFHQLKSSLRGLWIRQVLIITALRKKADLKLLKYSNLGLNNGGSCFPEGSLMFLRVWKNINTYSRILVVSQNVFMRSQSMSCKTSSWWPLFLSPRRRAKPWSSSAGLTSGASGTSWSWASFCWAGAPWPCWPGGLWLESRKWPTTKNTQTGEAGKHDLTQRFVFRVSHNEDRFD